MKLEKSKAKLEPYYIYISNYREGKITRKSWFYYFEIVK